MFTGIVTDVGEIAEIEMIKEFGDMKLRLITPQCEIYNATERDLPAHWDCTFVF